MKADEAKEEAQNLEKEISSGKITNGQLAVENDQSKLQIQEQ